MGGSAEVSGARRYDPYRRGGWRPLRLYRRSAEHQRSDCRSAGAVIAVRLGETLVAAESQRVRTARVPLMGVRQEYQFSRIGPIIALLLIEALREPFAKRNIDALEMSWILKPIPACGRF